MTWPIGRHRASDGNIPKVIVTYIFAKTLYGHPCMTEAEADTFISGTSQAYPDLTFHKHILHET